MAEINEYDDLLKQLQEPTVEPEMEAAGSVPAIEMPAVTPWGEQKKLFDAAKLERDKQLVSEPTRAPAQARMPAAYEDIDQSKQLRDEGMSYEGYIPRSKKGKILGKSGVTVHKGFDLGQRTLGEMELLHKKNPKVITKDFLKMLSPYIGKKGADAETALKSLPLDLKKYKAQTDALAGAWDEIEYDRFAAGLSKHKIDADKLSPTIQTALFGMSKQYGPGMWNWSKSKGIIDALKKGDNKALSEEVRAFDPKYKTRRGREADDILKSSKGRSPASGDVDPKKQKTALETLMDEYIKSRGEGEKEIASARKKDLIMSLADTLDKAFSRFDAATASEAAGRAMSPVGLKGAPLQSLEKLARSRNKEKRSELLSAYKAFTQGKLSPYQQATLKQRKTEHKERMEQRSGEEARRTKSQQRSFDKDIYGVIKDFEKDSTVKTLKDRGVAFSEAEELLKSLEAGNEVALSGLGIRMAKAMGEVGVMTDQDVRRYIQGQSVSRRVKDFFSTKVKGAPSGMTKKDIADITNIMKIGANKKLKSVRKRYIEYAFRNFGAPRGMSETQVAERFGVSQSKQSLSEYSPAQEKGIQGVMKANNTSREKAIAALKKKGKL